ncbi:MAG TPA: hypothetical protein VLC98_09330 [Phnomibacter sp.]|nr:hypothetical protein [Phnomibacter sp.]
MQSIAKPSRKKPFFPAQQELRTYLKKWGREASLPIFYSDLQRIAYSTPLKDKQGNDTLWEKAHYDLKEWDYLQEALVELYARLKMKGDSSYAKHLTVDRIDYCTFGNSNPFRIRIMNGYNDNVDHYYIKREDASRIYGLELEHIISPNRMKFLTAPGTLVEEHVAGVPGDLFVDRYLKMPDTNKIRLAKEIVKFNERCFTRLLGDMRSYNFVVEVTTDFEDFQYRLRPIDFDQQCYEGRVNLYRPQFFKENYPFVELVQNLLDKDSIEQYQVEERTLMSFRLFSSRNRMTELMDVMVKDPISTPEKTSLLKDQLNALHETDAFQHCTTMGELLKVNIETVLARLPEPVVF